MRRVTLRSPDGRGPFTGGMVTDFPDHEIGPANTTLAEDGYSPSGVFKQRQGWAYDGSVADVADNLVGVWRNKFALAGATRTVTADDDGDFFVHNSAGAGTALYTGTVSYLPRAVYRDELIFCAQDGVTPMRRYAGALTTGTASDLVGTTTASRATITALSFSAQPDPGSYMVATSVGIESPYKVLNTTSTAVTLEDIRASATAATGTIAFQLTGTAYPAVTIYNAGTATNAAGTWTGSGTLWVDHAATAVNSDAFMSLSGGLYQNRVITTVTSNTSIAVGGGAATDINYAINRPCPFKDVASHKNSLWGTGVAQFPNRVYVSPVNWNPSLPPGTPVPYDIIPGTTSANANDFLLDYIDVPTPYDGDANVAILPSPNQLWVLKRDKSYGIYGSLGGLDVSKDPIGPGCLDIRSAIAVAEGAFWASDEDVYWAAGEQAIPLMTGKIAKEWKALTAVFTPQTDADFITCGVAAGYLILYISSAVGTLTRCYLMDLRDRSWQCRLNNVTPRSMFVSRVPGEAEKLLAVSNDRQGRVLDLAPMVNGQGTADDDAGSFPRMKAYGPKIGMEGIEGVSRLVDVDLHTNLYDFNGGTLTSLDVEVVSEGGIGNPAAATKTLADIDSDTTDNVNRHHRRVARDGRMHQVRLTTNATGTDLNTTKIEVHEIDMFLRDGRSRSR